MLNVSATQELAKKGEEVEKKVAALEAENDRLKVQADRLATQTEALENENLNLRSANQKLAAMSSEIEVLKETGCQHATKGQRRHSQHCPQQLWPGPESLKSSLSHLNGNRLNR
jgi:uncharacterized protein YlxW (UPF0749 family)